LDPDISLIRQTDVRQPDFQWQYQLKHERDVPAQIQAVWSLEAFPTPQTRITLTEMIENEHCFVKVRTEACYVLAKVANGMISSWSGPPAMMNIFRKLFGSFSCPGIIKHNDFSNLQHYFLQKVCSLTQTDARKKMITIIIINFSLFRQFQLQWLHSEILMVFALLKC
jgi:transcription initiation factor TFIID subunit 2